MRAVGFKTGASVLTRDLIVNHFLWQRKNSFSTRPNLPVASYSVYTYHQAQEQNTSSDVTDLTKEIRSQESGAGTQKNNRWA